MYQPETEEEESGTEGKPAENNSDKTYSVDEEVEEEEEGAYFATAIYWELWRDHDLEPGIEVGYKKGG